jgi:hypothetical protein
MNDEQFRSALLSEPRSTLTESGLPPALKALVSEYAEAESVEWRRVLVGGVAYFEVLATWENLDEDAPSPRFVSGTIFDARGHELVDLDFEQRLATFAPSKAELAQNARLTAFMEKTFSDERLQGTALASAKIAMPAKLNENDGAQAYKVELEGRTYYAKVLGKPGAFEVLIFDAAFHGIGGSYQVGKEPFDVAEEEITRPLPAKPAKASGKASSAVDDFEAPSARKLTL